MPPMPTATPTDTMPPITTPPPSLETSTTPRGPRHRLHLDHCTHASACLFVPLRHTDAPTPPDAWIEPTPDGLSLVHVGLSAASLVALAFANDGDPVTVACTGYGHRWRITPTADHDRLATVAGATP